MGTRTTDTDIDADTETETDIDADTETGTDINADAATENAFDNRLFPYHEVLQPLFDIYQESNTINHHHREPPTVPGVVEVEFDGYWPNSASSIYSCLLPNHRAPVFRHTFGSAMMDTQRQQYWSNFSFLDEWEDSLRNAGDDGTVVEEEEEHLDESVGTCTTTDNSSDQYGGFHRLRKGEQTRVLLRLLKHSLSELQRDHRLARAILLYLIEIKPFENDGAGGLDALRYFLSIVKIDFIQECEGHCHERFQGDQIGETDEDRNDSLNHYCADVSFIFR